MERRSSAALEAGLVGREADGLRRAGGEGAAPPDPHDAEEGRIGFDEREKNKTRTVICSLIGGSGA